MMVFTQTLMASLFEMLENCRGARQGSERHPEGDVFVHSLQTMDLGFAESIDTDQILAAMFHDVDKAVNMLEHVKIACRLLEPYVSHKTHWLIEKPYAYLVSC